MSGVLVFGGSVGGSEQEEVEWRGAESHVRAAGLSEVALEAMLASATELGQGLRTILVGLRSIGGSFRLATVEVRVGVTGEGRLALLGIGGKAGAEATLTLRFVERDDTAPG